MRTCSISDCERPHTARGWCQMHYDRWHRYGSTDPHQRNDSAERPLVCICTTPVPTPTDMCATCYRVIAELVHQRRAARARDSGQSGHVNNDETTNP